MNEFEVSFVNVCHCDIVHCSGKRALLRGPQLIPAYLTADLILNDRGGSKLSPLLHTSSQSHRPVVVFGPLKANAAPIPKTAFYSLNVYAK